MNIGDLFFALRAPDRQLQADVKKAGDKAGKTLGQSLSESVRKAWSGQELGKGLIEGLGLAGGLGAANLITNALGSIKNAIGGTITAASDMQETISKGRVIFGENADAMEKWAGTASKSFGQSKRHALDTASTFAGLFDTVGIALGDATGMAQKLTVLGSDLASFFNTDVQTAVDSLRSGLAGESEPLRRFNVFLSETAVSSKLVSMGQQKVNGQWTEGQKILGRYQIILEQTTAAQGDFARTADGLANSQRSLNAQLEDLQAQLGEKLLPIANQVTQWQIDFIEGGEMVADWLSMQEDETLAYAAAVRELGGQFGYVNGQRTTALAYSLEILRMWREAAAAGYAYGQSVVTAADDTRESAVIAAGSIRGIGGAAGDAADEVETSTSDIVAAILGMQNELAGKGQTVADALYDPIIKAGELADTQAELASIKQQLRSKNLTAEEVKELQRRRQEVGKQLIELNAEILTFGTEAEQISKTKAFLASSFWADAYEGATPLQAAALDDWREALQTRLAEMVDDAEAGGKNTGQGYADGLGGQAPLAGSAAERMAGGAAAVFRRQRDLARSWGYNTGAAYAAGLRASYGLVNDAANFVAKGAVGPMKASSPPGPESPLHEIDVWGARTAAAYAEGFASMAPAVRNAALAVTRGAAGAFVAPTSRSLLTAPAATTGMGTTGPAGNSYEYHIHAEGQLKVPDPLAAANLLARFQGSGLLPEGDQ